MSRPFIKNLAIRYDSLKGIEIDNLSQGLNVIYGPNEAGKSRVKEFIEWMIFASSPQFNSLSPQAKKSAFKNFDPSTRGSLTIFTNDQPIEIFQEKESNSVACTSNNPNYQATDVLHLLNDDISLEHFRNVFSLDLTALSLESSNSLLTEDKVAEVFLSASQTGTGVSFASLVKELGDRKDSLYLDSERSTKSINRLIKDINETEKKIRQIYREEKDASYYSDEINRLNTDFETLSKQIFEQEKEHAKYIKIQNTLESFNEYQKLISFEPENIDSEIIGEKINISELLAQCEMRIEDEKELESLNQSIGKLKSQVKNIEESLKLTLNPDEVNDTCLSHKFAVLLEDEIESRKSYIEASARSSEEFTRENSELNGYISQLDEIDNKIESLTPIAAPSIQVKTKNKSKRVPLSATAIGFVATIISAIADLMPGLIIGLSLIGVGLALFLKNKPNEEISTPATNTKNDIELTVLAQSKADLAQKISTKENIIGSNLDSKRALDDNRKNSLVEFQTVIGEYGFNPEIDPREIQRYLKDLENYKEVTDQLESLHESYNLKLAWFESFYKKIQKLQKKCTGKKVQHLDEIKSLSSAQIWLKSVYEYAVENEKLERQVLDRESKIRSHEKFILDQYPNIEEAKNECSIYTFETLNESLERINDVKQKLIQEQHDIKQKIGGLENDEKHASKSRELSDLRLKVQTQREELKTEHKKYAACFYAHKLAENAFIKCQRDSQPEVLRLASHYFSLVTKNKWKNIHVNIDSSKNKSISVNMEVSNDLTSLSVSKLSRGAQEQLYLCLRLALIKSSTRGKDVPVLFDDIAVNSDPGRFSSIIPLISELSNEHQVFYFTCHKWVVDELNESTNTKLVSLY
ncbi:MAG: AAA family ATPase [Acidimicrobiia bacterium]